MNYSYVARQPILNSDRKTVAYELLFRNGKRNTFPNVDPEIATSKILTEQFMTYQNSSLEDKIGFVNFSYKSILSHTPTVLPKDKVVIEILEDCKPTPEMLSELGELKKSGYKLALDDFIPTKEAEAFYPLVDIIKFDLRQTTINECSQFIKEYQNYDIEFLAEKVETYEEFEQAKEADFHLFQGYFFSKPEVIEQKTIKPSIFTIVELCKQISEPEVDFAEVEKIISCDVTLSFKLLRFVNSTAYIVSPIDSFKQALSYLGEDRLRQFVSLVALAAVDENKPEALYSLSIQRARFCQLMTQRYGSKYNPSHGFICGLFSLLDSLLDQDLGSIINSIPIDDTIRNALLKRQGLLGYILELSIAIEKANWKRAIAISNKIKAPDRVVSDCYQQAIRWSNLLSN
ncbi:EAL and HDOD domain-containing protein [Vibrio sp. HN007]|uniref:EAL and HDOD domain-containing protein n=1 Tax=Vibrio iocasae TaxID=3098914 RepID=UPI0035D47BAA